jgi:hypothetical protein
LGPAAGGYAWHVHHQQLFEKLTAPLQERIDFIKNSKPSSEQALRLKLIRPVKDEKALLDADAKLKTAKLNYDLALNQTKTAYDDSPKGKAYKNASTRATQAAQASVDAARQISDLHRQECEPDCPWNGYDIFGASSRY